MESQNILITGANGQLGLALRERYPGAKAVDSKGLDIADLNALRAFDWSNIDIIINAAAYTNVDGAESSEGRVSAWKVNARGAANLAMISIEHDLTLVHISSEYVFDGSLDNHSEDEPFSPLGVYGQSKAAGDLAISLTPKHYIIRTSWMVGEGKNFVRTMIDLGRRGISPAVVDDQKGRLTFTTELVKAIDHLLSSGSVFGTYNMSNSGKVVSWADITREIFSLSSLDLIVTSTTTEEYFKGKPGIAPRPLNSGMNLEKIEATSFRPNDWHDDLKEYINKELSK
ncbi:MAG TPA: NAD(P)-dependent oxidoreductase [Candidatus Saccharimonadales bacterium]